MHTHTHMQHAHAYHTYAHARAHVHTRTRLCARMCMHVRVRVHVHGLRVQVRDRAQLEESLEADLRRRVSQHRGSIDLATSWDDSLSYLLAPALSSYETERLTGR